MFDFQVKEKELVAEKERLSDLSHYKQRIEADTLYMERRADYMKKRKADRRKLHGGQYDNLFEKLYRLECSLMDADL